MGPRGAGRDGSREERRGEVDAARDEADSEEREGGEKERARSGKVTEDEIGLKKPADEEADSDEVGEQRE